MAVTTEAAIKIDNPQTWTTLGANEKILMLIFIR
jgi:hypothetical protein